MSQQTTDLPRQHYRSLRRELSASIQREHAEKLASHLCEVESVRIAQTIACYLASDGEIGTTSIIETAWSRQQIVYLPVLSPDENSLYFAPYHRESMMRENRFGIPEPDVDRADWLEAKQLDVILMPLVAFDENGNRLGMGGGFYDRTLAFMRDENNDHPPELIGLAHELQRADDLEASSWDIPMHVVATEQRLLRF